MISIRIFILALMIFFEAGGESTGGKIAVANVAMNRANRNNKPIEEVLDKSWDSFWIKELDSNSILNKAMNNKKSFLLCIEIAQKVYHCEVEDNTLGATHFYNPKLSTPDWAPEIDQWMIETITIGNHRFIKETW